MIVYHVLIPGQNFLFPGTGREITKCHGNGNLRLVFPGITGNGNSRSPLSQGPYDEITEFDPPDVPSPPCTHTCWSLANQQRAPEILIDSFL